MSGYDRDENIPDVHAATSLPDALWQIMLIHHSMQNSSQPRVLNSHNPPGGDDTKMDVSVILRFKGRPKNAVGF